MIAQPRATTVGWTELDQRAVATARVLAADAVQKVGNGHPGTAISLAPVAYLLYQNVLRHDPTDPTWLGRDRFILSAGHTSLTQYIQLYLGGFGLELDDLEALRTFGSRTPGHPELHHTAGIEMTTGPLGQGLASSVGFALAARRERAMLDPDAPLGTSPFDHDVVVIASDGDMQEGVTAEAASIAGTQGLGNLLVIWDDNHISIEGNTQIAFTEDVVARFAAYHWHVQRVDWTITGEYVEDVDALAAAIAAARAETTRPSLIALRTIIAWPSPVKQNTAGAHGSALGASEVSALKDLLGADPAASFAVDPAVIAHTRGLAARSARLRAAWQDSFDAWAATNPAGVALLDRLRRRELPTGWEAALPTFDAGTAVATRVASGAVIAAIAPVLPELWGGSADLAGSNNTMIPDATSAYPIVSTGSGYRTDPAGRVLHFGIREHAMGAILTGISLHGLTRAFGGTFFQFADYMRPAVRLAALMEVPAIYVWTHDSIGLGEDGPTHQPVEHLAAYRAIPGLDVVRPADANETAAAWRTILERDSHPAGLVLSRQNLPVVPRGRDGFASTDGVARGAYTLIDASTPVPAVIIIATGSEVGVAVDARTALEADGIGTRVVSAPCLEWFAEQDAAYRDSVLPPDVLARVSVEAGIALSWQAIVGPAGRSVSLEHFGASADAETLFAEFGITPAAVVVAANESLAAAAAPPTTPSKPQAPAQGLTGDIIA